MGHIQHNAVILGVIILFPVVDSTARFTQFPPSVLYVQTGQFARFVWDYTVDNRNNEFRLNSPLWAFYDSSNRRSIIGTEDGLNGWKWALHSECPARLKTRVSKESTATLVISNVATADNGIYGCSLVLNGLPDKTSKVQLIVTVSPRFSPKLLLTKNITEGQDLSLPCTAIGPPTPNITWVKIVGNNRVIKSTGTGSATLSIQNIRRDQNGTYECQAKNNPNENRPITAQTVVTIYYPPRITVAPTNITVIQGNEIFLSCAAIGNPMPFILWTKAVGVIKPGHTTGKTLRIPDASKTDAGKYICTANNNYGSRKHTASASANIIVKYQPTIILDKAANQTIKETQSLVIRCEADGYPSPIITWMTPTGSVFKRNVLSIFSIKRSDAGKYTCTANNRIGRDAMTIVYVTVQYKPTIDVHKSSLVSKSWSGNTIRFKCFATGLPAPRISWYKPTNQQITSGVDIVPGGSEATVTTTFDQGDYGQYKCRATNIVGSDEHIINVTQLFSPGPFDIKITDIEATSLTVRWTKPATDGGRSVTRYLVEINTKQPITTVNTYTVITGLEKNTRYTVNVYAKNNVGYGMASTKVITTKKLGKPSVPELSLKFLKTEKNRLSVALEWAQPDSSGGIITKYTIYMKDVTIKSDWKKTKDVLDLSNLEYTITKNIEYGRTYKFIVTAWNEYGESVKDDWNAKTVNTTADKATYTSEKVVTWSTKKEAKYTIVIGVITAILVISIGLNILLSVLFCRRVKLNERKKNKKTPKRKSQHKSTHEEIYNNELEMEDNTLPGVVVPSAQQPRNPVPEYETIQQLNEQTSPQESPRTSHDPSQYQELNLPSNISTQESQKRMYEPLSTTSKKPKTQQDGNEQQPYESLGFRNQSSDYQSTEQK